HMRAFLSEVNKKYIEAHPERRVEFSERATQTLKKLWQDPAYRAFMHEKIIKGNKNHTTNKTGKVKFDKVVNWVFQNNKELSATTFSEARKVLYPSGAATKWDNGLYKYYKGDINKAIAEIRGNHKVRQIVFLNEREDVYDLTIADTHNFCLAAGVFVHNSIDGDPPAADRYTEAKMSKLSVEMLKDIEKDSVDWQPNYENTRKEPKVLPAGVPALLLNGTLGIAVGMATNIPPHHLGEVIDATIHLVDNKDATTEDLLQFIKGPDFPTGGLMFGKKDMMHAYTTGRGSVVVRGEAEIVEDKAGQGTIVITSIPFRVNKAELIMSIADLVREKKLEGIKDLRDESTKDVRIVIELKKGAYPQNVLNFLYKHTRLEEPFHFNLVALVDGVPQTLSLKSFLEEFIKHRRDVIKRRTEYDLGKALDREHILAGLKKALDHIDEIIKLIKKSKTVEEAREGLMKTFRFSVAQANAILEMRLQKLAGLERKKIEDELDAVRELIKDLKDILENPKRIPKIIKEELGAIREKYSDDRKTKVFAHEAKTMSMEDVIPDDESVLVYTAGGYIKRTDPDEFRKQKRGGVGVMDIDTKEEDFITHLITTTNHSDLLFFTDKGKVYQIKMYDIPEGKRATRGKSIMNFLSLSNEEKVTSILPMPKDIKKGSDLSLFLVTKGGTGKRVAAQNFHDVRRSGIIAIGLDKGDELVSASFVTKEDTVMIVSSDGQSIRFEAQEVREMGRAAGGVRVMRLDKGATVVGADSIKKGVKDAEVLVVSSNGFGKKTPVNEYKVQGRGGSGVKCVKVTDKTGKLISAKIVTPETEELIAISKKSQVIRCDVKEIPSLGRDTQGVRIMKLREGDGLASLICL
ncbi:MAG TPA: DNA gyrase subunit A, partial [Candidatus Paceibacterota bacterium]|nr:DNA gyrase subunit A [Candidatus Paceibacterota bacterium]